MDDKHIRIVTEGDSIEIRNLVDLYDNWETVRAFAADQVSREAPLNPNVKTLIHWLVVLGDRSMGGVDGSDITLV